MMTQLLSHWVTAEDMVRSRIWREGYESYRCGEPPMYGAYGRKTLAYEYGRLVAAHMKGQGHQLIRVQTTRPMYEPYVPVFVDAMEQVLWSE